MLGLTYKDNFSRVFDYTGDFEAFVIPKNATMLHIWAIGAGGPGGFGFSRAAGLPGGGGGGGATGAIVTMLVPTRFLPPTLYIYVGGGLGNTGGRTWVSYRRYDSPNNTIADSLLLANFGSSGGAGSAIGPGSAGAINSYGLANNLYAGLGTLTITVGTGGSLGGAHTGAIGGAINAFSGNGAPFTGGAGGAGCTTTDFTGGIIQNNANAQQHAGFTIAGGASGGGDGLNGLQFDEPFTCYGGSGGGSNNSGVGGKGGDGAIGCGGGGGGAGVTGGAGGRGGNGRVVITWF
jgi:hypothetical protein